MLSARDALARLRDGNRRFAADASERGASSARRQEVAAAQAPFAIILGCSDSRVPAEIVFDQGIGDLFVIRVAGNIVAPSQVASVEFAAEMYGTKLVMVLGHSTCGAIVATVDDLNRPAQQRARHLGSIVDRITPSVESLLDHGQIADRNELIARAVRANIRVSADHLRHGSEVLERLIQDQGLRVVGAEYSLESGLVDCFDGAEL